MSVEGELGKMGALMKNMLSSLLRERVLSTVIERERDSLFALLCFALGLERWQPQRLTLKALPHPTCC